MADAAEAHGDREHGDREAGAKGDCAGEDGGGPSHCAQGSSTTLLLSPLTQGSRVYYGKIKTHTDTPFTTSAPSVGFIND